jgi:hypothetical protein
MGCRRDQVGGKRQARGNQLDPDRRADLQGARSGDCRPVHCCSFVTHLHIDRAGALGKAHCSADGRTEHHALSIGDVLERRKGQGSRGQGDKRSGPHARPQIAQIAQM